MTKKDAINAERSKTMKDLHDTRNDKSLNIIKAKKTATWASKSKAERKAHAAKISKANKGRKREAVSASGVFAIERPVDDASILRPVRALALVVVS